MSVLDVNILYQVGHAPRVCSTSVFCITYLDVLVQWGDRHVQDFGISCSHEKDFSMTITHSQFYSKVLCFDSGFKHITPESDYMTLHDEGRSLKDPLISFDIHWYSISCWPQKQQSRTWVLIDNNTKQNIPFCLCILSISASKLPPRLSRVGDFSAQVSATHWCHF